MEEKLVLAVFGDPELYVITHSNPNDLNIQQQARRQLTVLVVIS